MGEVAEQSRIGSTTYERDPLSANKFVNSLLKKKKHENLVSEGYLSTMHERISIQDHFIFWRAIVQTTANMVVEATKA